jgi:hypothetical protein
MSSVGNAFQSEAKRSYLTARVFNADFYSYNQTVNPTTFQVSFALGAVVGATSGNCPVGRFLHETGRKLIPGANGGVNTLMVGVYDPVSGLSGFIDPNTESFTTMNTDKSANIETIVAGVNSVSVFGLNPTANTSDLGDPVFTRGDVTALGQATITGDITSLTGDITADQGDITATLGDVLAPAGDMTASGNITSTTGNISATLGNITAPAGTMTAFGNITSSTGNIVSTVGSVISAKQIFNPTISTLTIAGGNTDIDVSLATTFIVTSDSNFQLNAFAANLSSYAGAVVRVIISNPSGGSQISVTLGTNIRELYNGTGVATNLKVNDFTVTTTVVATPWTSSTVSNVGVSFATSGARNFEIPDNVSGVITFLCDGSNLLEMSRCLVTGS